MDAWWEATRWRSSMQRPSVVTPCGSWALSNSNVSRAQELLSTAWFGQQVGGAGSEGGPTRFPLSKSRHSPHGAQDGVRHASRGDGTHTWPKYVKFYNSDCSQVIIHTEHTFTLHFIAFIDPQQNVIYNAIDHSLFLSFICQTSETQSYTCWGGHACAFVETLITNYDYPITTWNSTLLLLLLTSDNAPITSHMYYSSSVFGHKVILILNLFNNALLAAQTTISLIGWRLERLYLILRSSFSNCLKCVRKSW